MHWAERCQTSCQQRNRAVGKPDIALKNPASLDLGGREKIAESVQHDIERNLKRRTGRAIQRRVQSNR
jgi:hypothetical protein